MYIILQQLPSIPSTVLNWVTAVQAFGSLILSLLIFLVYRKIKTIQNVQTDILGKQAEIMQRQNNILSAEYLPDISGEIVNEKVGWEDDEGDTSNVLPLRLINNGRGKAKNLFVTIYTYRLDSDEEIGEENPAYYPTFGLQSVGWGFATQAFTTDLRKRSPDTATEDMILPDGKTGDYHTEFEIIISRMLSDSKYISSFSGLVDLADKEWESTNALGFEIFVGYTDDTQQFGYTSICSIIDVPINPELELDEALDRAKIVNLPMRYFVPEGFDRGTPDISNVNLESGEGIYERDVEALAE